ncbi:MAG: hypothetical protein LUG46_09375, partial [Erysipelotrichaceae bacterium]|nr:hypothetical protein [Erysipelotrichaceae bacterium]
YKIIQTASPYKGHLWTYLNDITTTQKIELDDNSRNFLENGLDGILDILYDQCDLDKDWDLYTANTLTVTVNNQGMIQDLYAFIYAIDEDNIYHSWLIDYDASQTTTATIYLNNQANTDNISKQQLSPLFQMIDALIHSALINQLDTDFTIKYSGYNTIDYAVTTSYYYFDYSENTLYSYHENYDNAFVLKIYQDDNETLTILSEGDSIESDEEYENDTLVSNNNGMTYYLDNNHSMSLIVVDAAAGSRAYAFENDYIYNEDPFNGRIGVAESIYFMDEKTGFILIASASQDVSHMYYTTDGGITFTEVELPIDDEDYDYINTPYKENNILYVTVSYDSSNESSILFKSTDNGENWELVE